MSASSVTLQISFVREKVIGDRRKGRSEYGKIIRIIEN